MPPLYWRVLRVGDSSLEEPEVIDGPGNVLGASTGSTLARLLGDISLNAALFVVPLRVLDGSGPDSLREAASGKVLSPSSSVVLDVLEPILSDDFWAPAAVAIDVAGRKFDGGEKRV